MAGSAKRIGELQDEIKQRDRRIAELRIEIDEGRDLIRRMGEAVEEASHVTERWAEAFGMEMVAAGGWSWKPFWENYKDVIDKHNSLVREWNKYLHLIRQQPVGRPLAASEAQCVHVLKLHKAGKSLRWIAEETNLGFATVRTIIGKANRTDRASKSRWARIEPDRQRAITWKRQKRTIDALPKQAQRVVEEGRALLKEAKGLGRDG